VRKIARKTAHPQTKAEKTEAKLRADSWRRTIQPHGTNRYSRVDGTVHSKQSAIHVCDAKKRAWKAKRKNYRRYRDNF